jgi:hypothetical protein
MSHRLSQNKTALDRDVGNDGENLLLILTQLLINCTTTGSNCDRARFRVKCGAAGYPGKRVEPTLFDPRGSAKVLS